MAAGVAAKKHAEDPSDDFYTAKLVTARHYFSRILPRVDSHAAAARAGSTGLMALHGRSVRDRMSAPAAARGGARLARAKRVVVKIGSALLVEKSTGRVNRAWLETLAADVAAMRARGQEVVIVSSGAIALGRRQLGLAPGKLKLEESQAAAAVGQIRLAHAWKEVLEQHDCAVAQVLLTLGDTEERRRYLNARSTLNTLLKLGAIPVINENDTVATAEIRYGDNDRLAARVAQMASADCLVLLSDVDGLYTADPSRDAAGEVHPRSDRHHARDRSDGGRFGLRRGLRRHGHEGARRQDCGRGGVQHVHHRGSRTASAAAHRSRRPLHLVRGEDLAEDRAQAMDCGSAASRRACCTSMPARRKPCVAARACCRPASRKSKAASTGATRSSCATRTALEIARGLSAYSSEDARRASGRRSQELEAILGYRGRDELIHRDDLVLT